MTDMDSVCAVMKQREEEEVGWMRVKKKEVAVSLSIIAWRCSVSMLLDHVGHREFEYSDI
jgi:hypothetical protein